MENIINVNDLKKMIGRNVQVYRQGPESKVGRLLDVLPDYITVLTTENEIIHYGMSTLN